MNDIVFRCPLAALEPGECHDFAVDGIPLFVVRTESGAHCYLNQCPHRSVQLNWRPNKFLDINREYIQCTTHGALFRIENGECISGPCVGDQLDSVPLKIESGEMRLYRCDLPGPDQIVQIKPTQ